MVEGKRGGERAKLVKRVNCVVEMETSLLVDEHDVAYTDVEL